MGSPAWFASLLKTFFPYRKPIARLSRLPILSKLVDEMIFKGDEMVVLPKDRVVIQQAIEQPGSLVLPSSLVDHFIEKASYHWIMNFCICREGDNCQNFPHDLGCIFLGDAVLQINPAFGRLVTREEALAHARRCREAGLVHLVGRDRIDNIWLGVGPFGRLMTICNCCSCCCLFRMLPDLHPTISQKIGRLPGVSVWVDETCAGCGRCTRGVCFVDAIHLKDGAEQKFRAQIGDECRGCGRCVEVCPRNAIHLSITDDGYVQNAIRRISSLVNVDGKPPAP